MKRVTLWRMTLGVICGVTAAAVLGAPMTYNVDPNHTYPAFEADQAGGFTVWRGKVNSTSGTIVYDKEAGAGTVEVTMDMSTIDFGHDGMNTHAMAPDMLDVPQFPTATYSGTLQNFVNGEPTAVHGDLTLHGVTRPVNLEVSQFACTTSRQTKKEVCGAEATARFNRDDFGVDYNKNVGFLMYVNLLISIEAQIAE